MQVKDKKYDELLKEMEALKQENIALTQKLNSSQFGESFEILDSFLFDSDSLFIKLNENLQVIEMNLTAKKYFEELDCPIKINSAEKVNRIFNKAKIEKKTTHFHSLAILKLTENKLWDGFVQYLNIKDSHNYYLLLKSPLSKHGNTDNLTVFQNLINETNDATFLIEPESSHFLYVNDQACVSLGYTRDELLQLSVLDIDYRIKEIFNWESYLQNLREERSLLFETKHIKKDGSDFFVEINVKLISLADKDYIIAVARDITERKNVEKTLHKVQSDLSKAQAIAHVGSWSWNLNTDERYWSDETFRILGYEAQSFLPRQRHFVQRIHPDQLSKFKTAIFEAVQYYKSFKMELTIYLENNEERFILLQTEVINEKQDKEFRLLGTILDITERKKIEKKLEQALQERNTILESAVIGILFLKDMEIQWANKKIESIFGYTKRELGAKSICLLFQDNECVEDYYEKMSRTLIHNESWQDEKQLTRKNKESFWVHLIAKAISPTDLSRGIICVVEDIDEKKKGSEKIGRQALIIDQIHDSVVSTDIFASIKSWNKGAEDLFGYRFEEIYNLPISVLFPHSEHQSLIQELEKLKLSGVSDVEMRAVKKCGREFHVQLSLSLLRDSEAKVEGIIAYAIDISKRKKAELELERHRDHLDELVKVRTEELTKTNKKLEKEIIQHEKTEKALKESEALYRAVVEDQTELICRYLQNGRVHFVNDAFCRFFYTDREKILGKNYLDAIKVLGKLPEDQHYKILSKDNQVHFIEHQVQLDSGEIRWLYWTDHVILDDKENVIGYQSIGRDITDQKKAELALKESRETSNALLNAPDESAFLVDTDYTILALNETAATRLGGSVERFLGSNFFSHFPEELSKQRMEYVKQCFQDAKPLNFEDCRANIEFSINVYPIFNNEGEVRRVAIYASDITERKIAEKKLLVKYQLEDLISSISTRFIKLSIEEIDSEILFSLQLIGEYFEMDHTCIVKFDEDLSSMCLAYQWNSNEEIHQTCTFEYANIDSFKWAVDSYLKQKPVIIPSIKKFKDEMKFKESLFFPPDFKSHFSVPMIYDKNLIGFLAFNSSQNEKKLEDETIRVLKMIGEIFTNAIIRKNNEEQQKYLIGVLESTNQELKDFAHIVSHELKRPLGTARLQLSTVLENFNRKDQKFNDLTKISKKLDSLNMLINKILNYSSIGWTDEEMVEVNLHSIIEEAIENISPPKKFKIEFETEFPNIWFERTRILMVFENLLSNSVKHMDKKEGRILLGCVLETNIWKFWVKDNGPGIESSDYDKVFQLFHKLNDINGSTGIGLALVKKIIEMYEGEIWIESTPKKGTTVYFTLPQ